MTQEEKKMLEVELATRSQYGVICAVKPVAPFHELEFGGKHKIKNIFIIDNGFTNFSFGAYQVHGVENIKPYLRPLSSLTMDEQREYISAGRSTSPDNPSVLVDWFNAHHIDYRGLIDKGLALEAPADMYKTE